MRVVEVASPCKVRVVQVRFHAELRVVAKRVKVVEVTSSCRIQGRREEGEGRSQFFVRAFLL